MISAVKKNLFILLLLTISSVTFPAFCQSTSDSYEKLWGFIEDDSVSAKIKLNYLDTYIKKAQHEKNIMQQYKALEKKAFIIQPTQSILLLDKMEFLAYKSKKDSLVERLLATKSSFFYRSRNFDEALKYAAQAEEHISRTENQYLLNATRIDIGNIYYQTKHYKKAKEYFLKACNYYKTKKNYNHTQGLANSLYSLNKVYWQLNEIDSLEMGIITAEAILHQLKPDDRLLETAYINYAKGGFNYLKKNYREAERYLLQALPVIKQNEDFTNEYVIYLYLGKAAWQQNKKEKAVAYFSRIQDLFEQKKFLNYELREAYDYLILYYKDTKRPEKQLEATEQLIALNRQFEKEQQLLTNTLHYELETKKLKESKESLEQQMHIKTNTYSYLLIAAGILCFVFLGYSLWRSREHKKMRVRFNQLLKMQTKEYKYTVEGEVVHTETFLVDSTTLLASVNDIEETPVDKKNKLDEVAYNSNTEIKEDLSVTELRLLDALDTFEREKGFLKPVKLDDLALTFNTNRSTLSALMNKHKGSFVVYLNKLRIKQVMIDLKHQPQLRKLSMQGLGETYGFNNGKTFSAQFKSETGLTPSYFIEQLIIHEREELTKGDVD